MMKEWRNSIPKRTRVRRNISLIKGLEHRTQSKNFKLRTPNLKLLGYLCCPEL